MWWGPTPVRTETLADFIARPSPSVEALLCMNSVTGVSDAGRPDATTARTLLSECGTPANTRSFVNNFLQEAFL
jgi:hypothetical protein